MFELAAKQNPVFNHVEATPFYGEHLYAKQNGVSVVIKQHFDALPHQRYSVKSEWKQLGASCSAGNRRSGTSYRTKKTSKRFANLDDAIRFALAEIA